MCDNEPTMNDTKQGPFVHWMSSNKPYIGYDHPIGVIVLSVLGLAVWILGYRLVKPIVIIAAFIFAGFGFYSLSPMVLDTEFCCNENHNVEVRISLSIICGLIAGALACYVYKIGVFCMGCVIGWAVSIVVVTLWVSKHLRSDLAFYGIYGASGLAVGIVAVWLEKIFVIVATSFTGSLMFLLGLDCYCRTAFSTLIKQVLFQTKEVFSKAAFAPSQVKLDFNERHDEFTDQALAMFLGWLLMAAVGVILQFMYTAQEIDTGLFTRSCACHSDHTTLPDDKGVKYVVLPPPKPRALLMHQTRRKEFMKDSWEDIFD